MELRRGSTFAAVPLPGTAASGGRMKQIAQHPTRPFEPPPSPDPQPPKPYPPPDTPDPPVPTLPPPVQPPPSPPPI